MEGEPEQQKKIKFLILIIAAFLFLIACDKHPVDVRDDSPPKIKFTIEPLDIGDSIFQILSCEQIIDETHNQNRLEINYQVTRKSWPQGSVNFHIICTDSTEYDHWGGSGNEDDYVNNVAVITEYYDIPMSKIIAEVKMTRLSDG